MKAWRIGLVTLCSVAAGALLWRQCMGQAVAPAPAKPTRVGVLDVKEVLENYTRAKDLMGDLQRRGSQLEAEDKERKNAIDLIEAELGQLKKGGPEYERRSKDMQRLVIDREVWKKFQSNVLMGEHHALTKVLYEDIRRMAALVASQQAIDIVLYTEHKMPETQNSPDLGQVIESRKVIYADPAVDITETVLKRLNEAHRTTGNP